MVLSAVNKLEEGAVKIFLKMFDAQIQPIMLYGAEIWGINDSYTEIEKTHMFAMKRFLRVSPKTPNDIVYGEFGRYPLRINSVIRCIQFWLKLTRMESHRLPFKAYCTLKQLDEKGKHCWASDVCLTLSKHGYYYVWLNQGVESIRDFLKCFKQRMIDGREQEWRGHLEESRRLEFYNNFKVDLSLEPYLQLQLCRKIICTLTRFRAGVAGILAHSKRYSARSDDEMICPVCKIEIENEIHFMFCCNVYDDLRNDLIPSKYYARPSIFRLNALLRSKNENLMRNVTLFIYKALKRRENLI